MDTNNDGVITREELRAMTQQIGLNFTEKELAEMFDYADVNRDGNIDMEEFLNALSGQAY